MSGPPSIVILATTSETFQSEGKNTRGGNMRLSGTESNDQSSGRWSFQSQSFPSEKKEPEKQTVSKLVHWEHWVNLNLKWTNNTESTRPPLVSLICVFVPANSK